MVVAWRPYNGEETGEACGDEETASSVAGRLQPPETLIWARGGGGGPAARCGSGGRYRYRSGLVTPVIVVIAVSGLVAVEIFNPSAMAPNLLNLDRWLLLDNITFIFSSSG